MNTKSAYNFLIRIYPSFILVFVWFLFSSPFFLKGLIPFPGDYLVNHFSPWGSDSQFTAIVKNGAMPDILDQIVPWKMYTIDSLKQGSIPLWNPYSFSGTLHLANFQSAVLSPFQIVFFLFNFKIAWGWFILFQPLVAGIGAYLFLRKINRGDIASLIGSISFMFCGFMTVWMEYGTLGYAAAMLPWALYAIEQFNQSRKSGFLFLLALVLPISFFSGHVQTSIYVLAVTLLYAFVMVRGRVLLYTLLTIGIGMLLAMPQLLPSFTYFLQSARSGSFLNIEIVPWQYIVTLFAPDFYGHPVTGNVWFGHYAEWNGYSGVAVLVLALFGFFRKGKRELFFSLLAVSTILLAYDTPVINELVALHVPFFASAAASRILILWSFSVSILAAYGYDCLLAGNIRRRAFVVSVCMSMIVIGVWGYVLYGMKLLHNTNLLVSKQNLLLPTLFVIGTSILIGAMYRFSKNKRIVYVCGLLLLVLVSFDMLRFSTKWNPFTSPNLMYPTTSVTRDFAKYATPERVFGFFTGEVGVTYRLPVLDGYDPFNIKRYGEFIGYLQNGMFTTPDRSVINVPRVGKYTKEALDLLNVRYIFHKSSDDHASWTFPFWEYMDRGMELVGQNSTYEIYRNGAALPHVWLPSSYVVVSDQQKILSTLFASNFDRTHSIILEKSLGLTNAGLGSGSAQLVHYAPQQIDLKTQTNGPALVFLSEIYTPGWRAYVDGKETEIVRADYTFRAFVVPQGIHTIHVIYDPWEWRVGLWIAGVGIIFLVVLILVHVREHVDSELLQ